MNVLECPVLAYSIESFGSVSDLSDAESGMLKYYDKVIEELKKDSTKKDTTAIIKKEIKPLLGSLHLGQQKINLSIIGLSGTVVAGCVPTAATQIMYSYSWPEVIHGKYLYYRPENNEAYLINLDGTTCTWPDSIAMSKKNFVAPKQFLATNGLLFNADYGEKRTGANLDDVKRTFINHYGYSRKMNYVHKCNETLLFSTLISELEASRPVILGKWNHAFICDGYKDGYLHFNMGWFGYFNGYFRVFPGHGTNGGSDAWSIIYGIHPEKNTSFITRRIELTSPGTLGSKLTEEYYDSMDSLIISGPINGKDIRIIRQLSGGNDITVPYEKRGVLKFLDLSKATIEASKDVYYVSQPYKMRHEEWESCKTYRNCYVEEVVSGQAYRQHFHTTPNEIGCDMFSDCTNLTGIVLPENITGIMEHAFGGCKSLTCIKLPKSIKRYAPRLFTDCPMLEKVSVPKESKESISNYISQESTRYWFRDSYPLVEIEEY